MVLTSSQKKFVEMFQTGINVPHLIHELGHAYDFANLHVGRDLVSNDPEFIACYYNEYISDYGETSEQEFFAEAFALYFGSPKYLKDNAPRTFNYMQYQFGLYEE